LLLGSLPTRPKFHDAMCVAAPGLRTPLCLPYCEDGINAVAKVLRFAGVTTKFASMTTELRDWQKFDYLHISAHGGAPVVGWETSAAIAPGSTTCRK
jgi:hypothetical protein